jgi:hypothetical protein
MNWGRQTWYCPNCGTKHFDERLMNTTRGQAANCSQECARAWEVKYANLILGRDEQNKQ